MKTLLSISCDLVISSGLFAQSTSISSDDSSPNGSAMPDNISSSREMLILRMSEVQTDTIESPATKLLIFQTNEPTESG
jgi:hypothetical protein